MEQTIMRFSANPIVLVLRFVSPIFFNHNVLGSHVDDFIHIRVKDDSATISRNDSKTRDSFLVKNCDQYSSYEDGICPISEDHTLLLFRTSLSIPSCVLVEEFGQKHYQANGIYCLTDAEEANYVSLQTLFSQTWYKIALGKKKGSWIVYRIKRGLTSSAPILETPIYVFNAAPLREGEKPRFTHSIPTKDWRALKFVENRYVVDDNIPSITIRRLDLTSAAIKMIITAFDYHSGEFNICQVSTCYFENSSLGLHKLYQKELVLSYMNEFIANMAESIGNQKEKTYRLNDALKNIDNIIERQDIGRTKFQSWRLSELRNALANANFRSFDLEKSQFYLNHSILVSPGGPQQVRNYIDLGDFHLYMRNWKEANLSYSKANAIGKVIDGNNQEYFNEYLVNGRSIGFFLTISLSSEESQNYMYTRSKVILASGEEHHIEENEQTNWSNTSDSENDLLNLCIGIDNLLRYEDVLENTSDHCQCEYLSVIPISTKMGWDFADNFDNL